MACANFERMLQLLNNRCISRGKAADEAIPGDRFVAWRSLIGLSGRQVGDTRKPRSGVFERTFPSHKSYTDPVQRC